MLELRLQRGVIERKQTKNVDAEVDACEKKGSMASAKLADGTAQCSRATSELHLAV